jgi:hypothetical protein
MECLETWFYLLINIQKFETDVIVVRSEILTVVFMKKVASRATYFMFVSCLAYYSTLKMEVTCSSKTLVDFQWTTQEYIPEDWILQM